MGRGTRDTVQVLEFCPLRLQQGLSGVMLILSLRTYGGRHFSI